MSKHPESYFSDETWKGETGDSGLRNLYHLFSYLLARYGVARHQDQKTAKQRAIRTKAAEHNFNRMYNIGSRIKNGDYVSKEERKVWERVNYDINREVLRARLRAFSSSVLEQKHHPEVLTNHQSHMTDIFQYISDHMTELEQWGEFPSIVRVLKQMEINLETTSSEENMGPDA
jgi:hypothetical protein